MPLALRIESEGAGTPLPAAATIVPAMALAFGSELTRSTDCPAAPERIVRMLLGPMLSPFTSICTNEPATPATLPSWMTELGWKFEIAFPFWDAPATVKAPYGL